MDTSYFEADKDLIELAKKTCDEVNPDIHSYVGRVVSGDQFISDNEKKHYLINELMDTVQRWKVQRWHRQHI